MSELPVKPGVLPSQWLTRAEQRGWVRATAPLTGKQIQPASIDLRLGQIAHRLRCSFLPGKGSVQDRLPSFEMGSPLPLNSGAILERGRPYLIPLQERLRLPKEISARANPKSSTGRLDIFTRLVSDECSGFDDVRPGYDGPLYVEVVSRTFTIHVEAGMALNQLRLTNGTAPPLRIERLRWLHNKSPLLALRQKPIPSAKMPLAADGVFLSLDLRAGGRRARQIGWRAKKNSHLIDLTRLGAHVPQEFWEPVFAESGGGLVLEPEEFYLLMSREAVAVPPDYASEMTAFDPTSGELRTHYAGFFDPGFGYSSQGIGSRAALEVRAHDVPFKVEHGQPICKLIYLEMAETPDHLYGESDSNYQFQVETLSKHFRRETGAGATVTRLPNTVDDEDPLF